MNVSSTSTSPRSREDADYQTLVAGTRSASGWPLFTTAATNLYDAFLSQLPADRRQHYHCRACRKFIDRYGNLVTIDNKGVQRSLFWNWPNAPFFFKEALWWLNEATAGQWPAARITGVFLSSEPIWGLASNTSNKTGTEWHHLHVKPAHEMIRRKSPIKTDEQEMAEKLEDHAILCRSLAGYPLDFVRQAHTLLTTGALYRSEKCIGVAKWLLDLHEALAATKNRVHRENLIWRAVALAPPGYCHVKNTMIGTLLDDIADSKPFEEIKRSFDSKMSPIQYQRPQAAPTNGQLAAAEATVAKLASAGALHRRYAKLEEVIPHAIWTPKVAKATDPPSSVFGHLKSKKNTPIPIDVPASVMTWEKFSWTVLPTVERLELLVPSTMSPFFAFVTAVDEDAPPILQWDTEEKRNPVSWYLWHGGSMARHWNLQAGSYQEVTAVTLQPSSWNGLKNDHQGDGAYLIVKDARDLQANRAGNALFPEILKADYRSIRAAIEAYSRIQPLGHAETATACGLALQKSSSRWDAVVRATVAGARVLYRLDRWD